MSDDLCPAVPLASWAAVRDLTAPDDGERPREAPAVDLGRTIGWSDSCGRDVGAHGVPALDVAVTPRRRNRLTIAYLIPAGWLHLDQPHATAAEAPHCLPRGWYRVPDLRFDLSYCSDMSAHPEWRDDTRLSVPCPLIDLDGRNPGYDVSRLLRTNNIYADASICTGHMATSTWFPRTSSFAGLAGLASPPMVRDFVYAWLLGRPNDDLSYSQGAALVEIRDRMHMVALADWLSDHRYDSAYETAIARYGLYFHQWAFLHVYHPDLVMDEPSDELRAALDGYWAVTLGRASWSERDRRVTWPGETGPASAADAADGADRTADDAAGGAATDDAGDADLDSRLCDLLCDVGNDLGDDRGKPVDAIDLTLADPVGAHRMHTSVPLIDPDLAIDHLSAADAIVNEGVRARLLAALVVAGLTPDNDFGWDGDRYVIERGPILDAGLLMIRPR